MSFLFGSILRKEATTTAVATTAKIGSSGLLTKSLIGVAAISAADPILNGLAKIPVIGSAFQPVASLANSGVGLATSGVQGATGAVTGIGDVLSNPIYLLAGAGILVLVLFKK